MGREKREGNMEKVSVLTKILAVAGTVVVWLPIVAPFFFALALLFRRGRFLLDYLMPAELAGVAFVGGALLTWATIRAHSRRALIGWSLGIAVVVLLAGEGLGVLLGFPSGEAHPTWWQMGLVISSIVVYTLAVIAMGVGGILLLRGLFHGQQATALKA